MAMLRVPLIELSLVPYSESYDI